MPWPLVFHEREIVTAIPGSCVTFLQIRWLWAENLHLRINLILYFGTAQKIWGARELITFIISDRICLNIIVTFY